MYTQIEGNIFTIPVPLPDNPLRNLNSYLIRAEGGGRHLLIDTGFRRAECLDALQELVLARIRAYAASWFDPRQIELPETDTPARRRVQALREERRRLQSDVDRRRKAMQELYLDKASGLIDTGTFAQVNAAFLQQVQQAEARIAALEADLGRQQGREDARAAQMERVTELAKVPVLTRELAVLLVHRVVVSPKDPETGRQAVTIEWNF